MFTKMDTKVYNHKKFKILEKKTSIIPTIVLELNNLKNCFNCVCKMNDYVNKMIIIFVKS